MFKSQDQWTAHVAGQMREIAGLTQRREQQNERDALVDAFARGIDGIRAASDVPYVFDSRTLAEICVGWVLTQPRR